MCGWDVQSNVATIQTIIQRYKAACAIVDAGVISISIFCVVFGDAVIAGGEFVRSSPKLNQ